MKGDMHFDKNKFCFSKWTQKIEKKSKKIENFIGLKIEKFEKKFIGK
jgi:hypothetical protein